jgi:hypothetical protein
MLEELTQHVYSIVDVDIDGSIIAQASLNREKYCDARRAEAWSDSEARSLPSRPKCNGTKSGTQESEMTCLSGRQILQPLALNLIAT